MNKMLVACLFAFMATVLMGCPPVTTPPDPDPTPIRAWHVRTVDGLENAQEVRNLSEVFVVTGDTKAKFDFSGGNYVSGDIGYKSRGIAEMTHIAVLPDATKSLDPYKDGGQIEKYAGYPYGFYYGDAWYPDGYWRCSACNNAWYHGPCHYHGVNYGYPYGVNNEVDIDFDFIIENLIVGDFPATASALTENGEFSITVPMSPVVETAVLTIKTENGSFVVYIRGEAYGNDESYTLTVSSDGQGTITGAGTYDAGTVVTVTATPAAGWLFDHWMVNGTRASSVTPASITMDSDVTLVGVFTQNQPAKYTLTTQVGGGQGTITGAGTYDAGTVVTVTATPASGYSFAYWTVNGTRASSVTPASITMDSDVTLVGVFTQNQPAKYTLTTQVGGGQGTITGAGTYDAGTVVTVTATPASGWLFDHWSVNGTTSTANPGTVTMNSDVALKAYFVEDGIPPETTGKLIVDLTAAAGIVSLEADAPDGYAPATFGGIGSQAQIQSVGLQLFYEAAVDGLWTDRQTFAFSAWPVTGVMTKVHGRTLRFEVVANASGGWGDPEKMVVKLNGVLVPRVADSSGNVAYQVTLP